MKKISFLLVLSMSLFLLGCGKGKVDVRNTWFEYDVEICDKYFELVGCIIDNDNDENYTEQMRVELKNEVKKMQEEWKLLDKEELTKKCSEEFDKFKSWEDNLKSFGCSIK